MSSTKSEAIQAIQYSRQATQRAEKAVICSPFQLQLFVTMRWQGVALRAIANAEGTRNRYTRRLLSEMAVENHLLWLIQVGVLRREVDGQGLTDSFRLTPLGRQLLDKWQQIGSLPPVSVLDHLQNAWRRWVRLPAWLS
jgi:hypothetical protein